MAEISTKELELEKTKSALKVHCATKGKEKQINEIEKSYKEQLEWMKLQFENKLKNIKETFK